jgi:site-specific recombinase XerD
MATVSACTRPSRRNDGQLPLYLRITHKGSTTYLSLGEHVPPTHWSASKKRAKRSFDRAPSLNRALSDAEREAERIITDLQRRRREPASALVKEQLEVALAPDEDPADFLGFCERLVERYRARGQSASARTYRTTVSKLKTFLKKLEGQRGTPSLPIGAVDVALLERYRTWELTERGNKENTVAKSLGHLRTFCNAAIREGLMAAEAYPFRHITIAREETPRHQWLRKEEVEALAGIEPTPGTVAAHAKRVFLFQYYAWGMRISDALFFEWEDVRLDEGRLQYRMRKTSKHLDLPLTPKARAQIAPYMDRRDAGEERIFPLLDGYDLSSDDSAGRAKEARTAKVNQHLSDFRDALARDGALPEQRKLSTHTARHSAACQMYLAWKELYRIKRYLGHSSVTQTEKYLRSMEGLPLGEDGQWEGVL